MEFSSASLSADRRQRQGLMSVLRDRILVKKLMGITINCLFQRLQCQRRTQTLMYPQYTAVLCAMLPCAQEKNLLDRDTSMPSLF